MLTITTYKITPYLPYGEKLPATEKNNGTDWLRTAVNMLYNRHKARLKNSDVLTNVFHDHNEETQQTIVRYPLITYINNKQKFYLTAINEGCEAMHVLLEDMHMPVMVSQRLLLGFELENKMQCTIVNTTDKFTYQLTNWLALSHENHKQYQQCASLGAKISFLEKVLESHIVKDFAHYLKLELATTKVVISSIESFNNPSKSLMVNKHFHDYKPFTVVFSTNVMLPPYICLGNGKVYGYGLIQQVP